eukprot:g4263.t1
METVSSGLVERHRNGEEDEAELKSQPSYKTQQDVLDAKLLNPPEPLTWPEAMCWEKFDNCDSPDFFQVLELAQDGGFSEVRDLWNFTRYIRAVLAIAMLFSNLGTIVINDSHYLAHATQTTGASIALVSALELVLLALLLLKGVSCGIRCLTTRFERIKWCMAQTFFWEVLPELTSFSAMRLLHFATPSVVLTDLNSFMEYQKHRGRHDGRMTQIRLWLQFVLKKLICFVVGVDAFLFKVRELPSLATHLAELHEVDELASEPHEKEDLTAASEADDFFRQQMLAICVRKVQRVWRSKSQKSMASLSLLEDDLERVEADKLEGEGAEELQVSRGVGVRDPPDPDSDTEAKVILERVVAEQEAEEPSGHGGGVKNRVTDGAVDEVGPETAEGVEAKTILLGFVAEGEESESQGSHEKATDAEADRTLSVGLAAESVEERVQGNSQQSKNKGAKVNFDEVGASSVAESKSSSEDFEVDESDEDQAESRTPEASLKADDDTIAEQSHRSSEEIEVAHESDDEDQALQSIETKSREAVDARSVAESKRSSEDFEVPDESDADQAGDDRTPKSSEAVDARSAAESKTRVEEIEVAEECEDDPPGEKRGPAQVAKVAVGARCAAESKGSSEDFEVADASEDEDQAVQSRGKQGSQAVDARSAAESKSSEEIEVAHESEDEEQATENRQALGGEAVGAQTAADSQRSSEDFVPLQVEEGSHDRAGENRDAEPPADVVEEEVYEELGAKQNSGVRSEAEELQDEEGSYSDEFEDNNSRFISQISRRSVAVRDWLECASRTPGACGVQDFYDIIFLHWGSKLWAMQEERKVKKPENESTDLTDVVICDDDGDSAEVAEKEEASLKQAEQGLILIDGDPYMDISELCEKRKRTTTTAESSDVSDADPLDVEPGSEWGMKEMGFFTMADRAGEDNFLDLLERQDGSEEVKEPLEDEEYSGEWSEQEEEPPPKPRALEEDEYSGEWQVLGYP